MVRIASLWRPGLTGTASARRAFLVLACVLAFALQSFVAQTHIHPLLLSAKPAASFTLFGSQPDGGSKPGQQDDLNSCPYCQAATLVGLVLGPSALLLFLPAVQGVVAPVSEPDLRGADSPSHVWRSRGPPQI